MTTPRKQRPFAISSLRLASKRFRPFQDELMMRCQQHGGHARDGSPLWPDVWLGYKLSITVLNRSGRLAAELYPGLTPNSRIRKHKSSSLRHRRPSDTRGPLGLRSFRNLDDLKAWLFLIVSDLMISRGEFTALHAAGFVQEGHAILVCGPPWSGKSSWALEALRRG